MSSELAARGDLVEVRPPRDEDATAYGQAVRLSERRLSTFAVPDPDNLPAAIAAQSEVYCTFMVVALDAAGSHGLVGRVNVANIVRGAFRSATMGYDAYDPYAGRGLFVEGLRLVLHLLFADAPEGMGLHRVEANIQPANIRSAGMARSLGFVNEGFSKEFLHLPGVDGRRGWRDHDRYAMLASDWPAVPYRHRVGRRLAVVVRPSPVWDPAGLAPLLAAELAVPLYTAGPGLAPAVLFELLRASPVGGVVECRTSGAELRMGLARARFDPAVVPVRGPVESITRAEVTRTALETTAAFAATT